MAVPHKVEMGGQVFSYLPWLTAPYKSVKGCSWVEKVETEATPFETMPKGAKVIFRTGLSTGDEVIVFRIDAHPTVIFFASKGTKAITMIGGYSLNPDVYERIRGAVRELAAAVPKAQLSTDTSVNVKFWRMTGMGATASGRTIDAPPWAAIAPNYAPGAREKLDRLSTMTRAHLTPQAGKLVVLYGPPGSGKTTFLRSLARSWSSWAQTNYITDPDALLNDAGYLWDALMTQEDFWDDVVEAYRPRDKLTLVIMEDVDELIVADAKERTGQSFSRLLNLGDGFIGQGAELVIVLTTNEPVSKLAPAIVRPGRALAQIEVPKFSRTEAAAWLERPDFRADRQGYTLAELYEILGETFHLVSTEREAAPGQYL